jgi:hypothetical protein
VGLSAIIQLTLLLLLGAPGGSCKEGIPALKPSSTKNSAFSLGMSVPRDSFDSAPLNVTLSLMNRGARPLTYFHFEAEGCFRRFYVRLKLNRVEPEGDMMVPLLEPVCPIRSWPGVEKTIEGGGKADFTVDLNSIINVAAHWPGFLKSPHTPTTLKLRPGRYRLTAIFDSSDLASLHPRGQIVRTPSGPVEVNFEVRDPASH